MFFAPEAPRIRRRGGEWRRQPATGSNPSCAGHRRGHDRPPGPKRAAANGRSRRRLPPPSVRRYSFAAHRSCCRAKRWPSAFLITLDCRTVGGSDGRCLQAGPGSGWRRSAPSNQRTRYRLGTRVGTRPRVWRRNRRRRCYRPGGAVTGPTPDQRSTRPSPRAKRSKRHNSRHGCPWRVLVTGDGCASHIRILKSWTGAVSNERKPSRPR